jgi:hypothetical protein
LEILLVVVLDIFCILLKDSESLDIFVPTPEKFILERVERELFGDNIKLPGVLILLVCDFFW